MVNLPDIMTPGRLNLFQPKGWRVAGGRDIFAEFCTEYLKGDLLLWARIVLPTDTRLSHQLETYGNAWDEISDAARLEAQNLLKGVKAEYVMQLDLEIPPSLKIDIDPESRRAVLSIEDAKEKRQMEMWGTCNCMHPCMDASFPA